MGTRKKRKQFDEQRGNFYVDIIALSLFLHPSCIMASSIKLCSALSESGAIPPSLLPLDVVIRLALDNCLRQK